MILTLSYIVTSILFSGVFFLTILHFYVHLRTQGRLCNLIPGPKSYPIIGNFLDMAGHPEDIWNFLHRTLIQYYPVWKIWLGIWPIITICHPDDAQILLTSTKHVDKSIVYDLLHSWLQDGLLTSTETCFSQCPSLHGKYKTYMERIKYLSRLPNSRKLKDLALIGTHHSLSYNFKVDRLQTQDFDIYRQLKYGIRVLHVEIHQTSNSFVISLFGFKIDDTFSDLLRTIDRFLAHNPWEFVIMLLEINFELESDEPKRNCDIIDHYINTTEGGRRFVKNWRLNDTIEEHRGKILLASDHRSLARCVFNTALHCQKEKIKMISLNDKWSYLLPDVIRALFVRHQSFDCYIDDISIDDGIHSRREIARDGGFYHDSTCLLPINQLMIDIFKGPPKSLYIVISDFVTQELMDKINDFNFDNSSWRSGWT